MKTKVNVHNHREKGITYLEDIYTQYELLSLNPEDVKSLIVRYDAKIYVCSSSFINLVGRMIAEEILDYNDFEIIGRDFVASYNCKGYLVDYPIGYTRPIGYL